MNTRSLLAGLVLAASALAADRAALVKLFHQNHLRYVDPNAAMKTADSVDRFLADATAAGIVRTPADRGEAKRIYAEIVAEHEARIEPSLGGGGGPLTSVDFENNDTTGLAFLDPVCSLASLPVTINGTVGPTATDPRDLYVLANPVHQAIKISVQDGTSAPPTLFLSDLEGRFFLQAIIDPASPLERQITLELPEGRYLLNAAKTSAATYAITISPATIGRIDGANAFRDLCTSGPINEAVSIARQIHCYRLNVTAESVVRVAVQGQAPFNGVFVLARPRGGRILVIDQTGSATGDDPILEMPLPRGHYIVWLLEAVNGTGSYSISASCTPATIPDLPCGTPVNGNVPTFERRDLYRMTPAQLDSVVVRTTAGSFDDTILEMYDADMGPLAENDDVSFPSDPGSFIKLPLPASVYYVSVRHFDSFGGVGSYGITRTCGPLQPITAIRAERTAAVHAIPPLDSTAFSFSPCTDTHLEISASSASARLSVYGRDGRLRGWYGIGGAPGSTSLVGLSMTAGEMVFAVARTLSAGTGFAGPFSMMAQGGIGLDPNPSANTGTLRALDKVGRLHALFAGPPIAPFTFPPILGSVCILPNFVLFEPIVGTGRHPYTVLQGNVPALGILELQALSFGLDPRMTNTTGAAPAVRGTLVPESAAVFPSPIPPDFYPRTFLGVGGVIWIPRPPGAQIQPPSHPEHPPQYGPNAQFSLFREPVSGDYYARFDAAGTFHTIVGTVITTVYVGATIEEKKVGRGKSGCTETFTVSNAELVLSDKVGTHEQRWDYYMCDLGQNVVEVASVADAVTKVCNHVNANGRLTKLTIANHAAAGIISLGCGSGANATQEFGKDAANNKLGAYQALVDGLRNKFNANAEICLIGCNIGDGVAGQNLVDCMKRDIGGGITVKAKRGAVSYPLRWYLADRYAQSSGEKGWAVSQ
jgi:hypothetical protein